MELETWLTEHPESIATRPAALLDRCEAEIREHAQQDAWQHAIEVAEQSLHRFDRGFGLPASGDFVAREVCHEIARALRSHEPHPDARQSAGWVDPLVFESVEPDARRRLHGWIRDLAQREEHEIWAEIVRFADHLAQTLIHREHLTSELEWAFDRSYPKIAARITRLMIREFEQHAARHEAH